MKFRLFITRNTKTEWPIRLTFGFLRPRKGKAQFIMSCRTHGITNYLFYTNIPYLFQIWIGLEKQIISTSFCGFINQGIKRLFDA